MTAYEKYDQPRMKVVVTPNKQVLGKTFKRQAKAVQDALEQMQVVHLELCVFRIVWLSGDNNYRLVSQCQAPTRRT